MIDIQKNGYNMEQHSDELMKELITIVENYNHENIEIEKDEYNNKKYT